MADVYMQFNSHADQQDCVSEINKICKTNTTSYPLKDIARRFNHALDRYFEIAFEAYGRWNFDDITQTSPPIDSQNIVSGTNRYKIATFTGKVARVIRVEVLNSAGKGLSLIPELLSDLDEVSLGHETGRVSGIGTDTFQERYVNASSGVPTHYIKYGDFIYLRPNPNYAYTAGLLCYFNRSATHLASTATTTAPGVYEGHIKYLCRLASLPYLIENGKPNKEDVKQQIAIDEIAIKEYFSSRDEDVRNNMSPHIDDTH